MGSAPVRRSWGSRMGSSARRKAFVPVGAPGVVRTRQGGPSGGTLAVSASGGGGGEWTEIVNAWVWDAGLYLGADFDDMIGFPTTASDADTIEFWVLPPGSDSHVLVTNDPSSQEPYGRATRSGMSNTWGEQPDPSTPDAGSHLWCYWYGPDFDPSTDPFPSVPPASLVPAALAANGEA